jgi:hypothetical protein
LFNNYRIQSNANNEITVTLNSEALLGALKSASTSAASGSSFNTEEIVVKLAKKSDHALLTFEIHGQTRTGNKMRVAHDVKIQVMKPADVAKLSEPLCPEPDVCVFICPADLDTTALFAHSREYLCSCISSSHHFKKFAQSLNDSDPCPKFLQFAATTASFFNWLL